MQDLLLRGASHGLSSSNALLRFFRVALLSILLASATLFLVFTWHWPLVGDASFFHYMVSLLRLGQAPYRDFVDVNLPGTYAVQVAVVALIGPGPHAFRLFDIGLLLAAAAAMFVLCRANAGKSPGSKAALPALFAAVLFAVVHGRDGLMHQGQRDLVLAVLYLGACAFLQATLTINGEATSTRRIGLVPSVLGGLLFGFACTIKPSALLMVVPTLGLLGSRLRSQKRASFPTCLAFLAATLLGPVLALCYLVQQHALGAFWQMVNHLLPYHASLNRQAITTLIFGSVSSVCLPLFLMWLLVFLSQRRYRRPLDQLLLIGFLAGCGSYVLQGRGYPYHRYPSEAFLALLAAVAFCDALWPARSDSQHTPPWVQITAAAGLSVGTFFLVPRSLQLIARFDSVDQFTTDLRGALDAQGGTALNRRIQCLDSSSGCLNALQQMRLVEATGYLYDCYLYSDPKPTSSRFLAERDRYRESFRQAVLEDPPHLFIVSSQSCGGAANYSYAKLAEWPWLERYLDTQYSLIEDHIPSGLVHWGGRPQPPVGFRIYRRKP